MDSINLMMEEHQNILRMLTIVRKACFGIMKGNPIDYTDLDQMIDFIRNYADAHHHGKEEKLLFNEMIVHLGPLGNKLVTHGMLVEHDLGRFYIQELKAALDRVQEGDEESRLDVISNAVGYANHLKRHIEKEDAVVYTFARRQLSAEVIDKVNRETIAFEEAAKDQGIQERYQAVLESLEKKYLA